MKIDINSKEERNKRTGDVFREASQFADKSTIQMIKAIVASAKNDGYKLNVKRLLIAVAAVVVYVVSPYDIVPEALLGLLGVADDLGVVALIIRYVLKHEIGDFKKWTYENNIGADADNELM